MKPDQPQCVRRVRRV